jgi:hypothetical protein
LCGVIVISGLDEHGFEFLKAEHHDRGMGFRREDIRHRFSGAGLKEEKVDCARESCRTQADSGSGYESIGIFLALGEE